MSVGIEICLNLLYLEYLEFIVGTQSGHVHEKFNLFAILTVDKWRAVVKLSIIDTYFGEIWLILNLASGIEGSLAGLVYKVSKG